MSPLPIYHFSYRAFLIFAAGHIMPYHKFQVSSFPPMRITAVKPVPNTISIGHRAFHWCVSWDYYSIWLSLSSRTVIPFIAVISMSFPRLRHFAIERAHSRFFIFPINLSYMACLHHHHVIITLFTSNSGLKIWQYLIWCYRQITVGFPLLKPGCYLLLSLRFLLILLRWRHTYTAASPAFEKEEFSL